MIAKKLKSREIMSWKLISAIFDSIAAASCFVVVSVCRFVLVFYYRVTYVSLGHIRVVIMGY